MAPNPYAPPTADVADVRTEAHGLKHRSVWLMLVFTVISLGFYPLIWFFRRRSGLNRLDSPRKLPLWPPLLAATFFGIQFVLGAIAGANPDSDVISPGVNGVLTLFQLFIGITMIIQTFHIREIIQDHATSPPDPDQRFVEQVQLSGLMTFFFSIFYLQWAINKYVVGDAAR